PYELWFFYGTMDRADFAVINPKAANGAKHKDQVYAVVTIINDIVVRGALNPLDSGNFPYNAIPWLRRPGHWAGIGIAEQVVVPQRITNAATRALLNNAGISA